jgi:hypothetical protein
MKMIYLSCLVSKKNNLDDFVIFLSNQSYKGIYIVFGSKKEESNFTEEQSDIH